MTYNHNKKIYFSDISFTIVVRKHINKNEVSVFCVMTKKCKTISKIHMNNKNSDVQKVMFIQA